jgi:hypothetical protein
MAATKLSVHMLEVALAEEVVLDHVEGGWVQVFAVDYRGGSGRAQDYLVTLAVVEPIADEEASRHRAEHVPGRPGSRYSAEVSA